MLLVTENERRPEGNRKEGLVAEDVPGGGEGEGDEGMAHLPMLDRKPEGKHVGFATKSLQIRRRETGRKPTGWLG